jgi:transcriptional activator of cad operon
MKFAFENFIVDDSLLIITKEGRKQEVEPRIFELLVYFCRHPNVPISRDSLIENVWQQRIVGHAAINRAVSELRKIIELDPSKPVFIKTISKVGYQLDANFSIIEDLQDQNHAIGPNGIANISKPPVLAMLFSVVTLLALSASYFMFDTVEKVSFSHNKAKPITSMKGTAFRGALSDKGDDLVFLYKPEANSSPQIWLSQGENPPQQLTADSFYYTFAIFGTDNKVFATRFNNLHQRSCEIVAIDINSKHVEPLLACAERAITIIDYDDAKEVLYFNSREDVNAPFSVYTYHLQTQRLQQLTFPYGDGNIRGDYLLALSPDATHLAVFEYQNNSKSILKVIDLASKRIIRHAQEFDNPVGLSWLDDNTIVSTDNNGLLAYDIVNMQHHSITSGNDIGHSHANAVTSQIIFDKGRTIANIYQFQLDKNDVFSSAKAITHSGFMNFRPKYANTSLKKAYISTDDGDYSVMIAPTTGTPYQASLKTPINNFGNLHWSPDDKYLIASINNQLHLFDEKEKKWQILLSELNSIHFVYYSDEQHILFSSDHSGDWQIWSYDLVSHSLSQITKAGGYSVQGNIKNDYIYLTKFNHPGIYKLNLLSHEETSLLEDFKITSWNKWVLRSGDIYYIAKSGIMLFNELENTEKLVLPIKNRAPDTFTVSFDQQYLLKEKIEHSDANIWQIYTNKHSYLN